MPNCVFKMLEKLQHIKPKAKQDAPHRWSVTVYGKRTQLAKPTDTSKILDAKETQRIQSIVDSLLYYGRAVDYTIYTDAAYLVAPNAKGRIVGYFYMSDSRSNHHPTVLNAAVHI